MVELPESPSERSQTETPQPMLGEIQQLEAEAKEATERVLKLESQASNAMRQYNDANEALPNARAKQNELLAKLYALRPTPLPPIPTREQMVAMAREQRQDWDDRKNVQMAERMHAMCASGMARQSESYYLKPPPKMTGTEVKDISDSHYDLKPPRQPRERKTYPND
jgi:hypothetical protein